MNRHVLIGRFGARDKLKVDCASDEVSTRVELLNGAKRIDHDIGAAIDTLARANRTLTLFHTRRREDIEAGKQPTVRQSLERLSS